jgi:hypothetical protein
MGRSEEPGKEPMSNPNGNGEREAKEQDLQATEDSIRADLARLATLESSKTTLAPDDPGVDTLSDEAVELADGIARKTRAERELGRDLG